MSDEVFDEEIRLEEPKRPVTWGMLAVGVGVSLAFLMALSLNLFCFGFAAFLALSVLMLGTGGRRDRPREGDEEARVGGP